MSSRHSGSSRHRSYQSRSTDTSAEEMIEQVKTVVTQLNDVVASSPHDWETYLPSARSAVAALEHVRFFRDPQRYAEQVWILHGLQDYAFHDPDSGCIPDIADYCQASWLRILRNYPENVETLTGLGSNWLQRAQATLARIQREEGNDSSSQASPPTDPRRQGPLYIEARGYLQPAVDFYARAVRASDALEETTGEILASAAESQMSLGNVTASPGDERCFTQAIRYLRRAEAVPAQDSIWDRIWTGHGRDKGNTIGGGCGLCSWFPHGYGDMGFPCDTPYNNTLNTSPSATFPSLARSVYLAQSQLKA